MASPRRRASDVYGVGILLYELLTGQVPWDGAVQKILQGHLDEKPRPPSTLIDGGLDPALENLVLHALAKRPAERHKDMAAFIYELKTVMDMLGIGRRRAGVRARRAASSSSKRRREANKRDELARIAFDACRLPLALLSPQGLIVSREPGVREVRHGRLRRGRRSAGEVDAARAGVVDGRARHRAHARGQPDSPHHRNRRVGERNAPPAALARRVSAGSRRPRRAAARTVI